LISDGTPNAFSFLFVEYVEYAIHHNNENILLSSQEKRRLNHKTSSVLIARNHAKQPMGIG
jgi:hypothetical protein